MRQQCSGLDSRVRHRPSRQGVLELIPSGLQATSTTSASSDFFSKDGWGLIVSSHFFDPCILYRVNFPWCGWDATTSRSLSGHHAVGKIRDVDGNCMVATEAMVVAMMRSAGTTRRFREHGGVSKTEALAW